MSCLIVQAQNFNLKRFFVDFQNIDYFEIGEFSKFSDEIVAAKNSSNPEIPNCRLDPDPGLGSWIDSEEWSLKREQMWSNWAGKLLKGMSVHCLLRPGFVIEVGLSNRTLSYFLRRIA